MPTYLVTGASNGIGRALIDSLVAGAGSELDVILAGRDADRLAAAAAVVTAAGGTARSITPDLTDPASVAASLDGLKLDGAGLERLDGLIHVAGTSERGRIADATARHWDEQFAINLLSPIALTTALLEPLRAARGTVVFVNSVVALAGAGAGGAAYVASKVALRSFADQLRLEEPLLRVGSVYPGRVATDMQRTLRDYEGLPFEPEKYASAASVAAAITTLLSAPDDVEIRDITVMPRGR